jgi:vacuolar iron transporter family protein
MTKESSSSMPSHFKGKEAIEHVAEAQALGIIASSETHGTEIPGHVSAATDAAREIALSLAMVWVTFSFLALPMTLTAILLGILGSGWILWKSGRGAWLAWFRLERLHRIVAQEKWEIEHHRQQEREELKALYAAKGFEGKLLEEVLDVLMADGDRLLRVMVEEELGLSLESHEHPLKQALGAFLGSLSALLTCLFCFWIYPQMGLFIGSTVVIGISSTIAAQQERNRIVPAIVWNLGLAAVSFGFIYFMVSYFILTP